jgi:hypothetical protein
MGLTYFRKKESEKVRMNFSRVAFVLLLLQTGCQSPPLPATNALGVAECDEYLSKYEACLDLKVPAEVRETLNKSLEQTRNSWRAALSTPDGAKSLGPVCRQIRESRKRELVPYGCPEM